MRVVLYSTNCPQCIILEKKLKEKDIKFEVVTDPDEMIDKGFISAPILDVDSTIMTFKEAVDWVNQLGVQS